MVTPTLYITLLSILILFVPSYSQTAKNTTDIWTCAQNWCPNQLSSCQEQKGCSNSIKCSKACEEPGSACFYLCFQEELDELEGSDLLNCLGSMCLEQGIWGQFGTHCPTFIENCYNDPICNQAMACAENFCNYYDTTCFGHCFQRIGAVSASTKYHGIFTCLKNVCKDNSLIECPDGSALFTTTSHVAENSNSNADNEDSSDYFFF